MRGVAVDVKCDVRARARDKDASKKLHITREGQTSSRRRQHPRFSTITSAVVVAVDIGI
jgi:hypothetical protein